MFAKLLKYDSRAVVKYWWIAALSSLLVALFGGVCIQIVKVDYTNYAFLQALAVLGIVLSVIALFILPVLTEILILVRFYKHFFTDEGYLTFTLPVKKTTLLNSKMAMAFLFSFATVVLLVFDVFLMLAVGIPEEIFSAHFWNSIITFLIDFYTSLGWYAVLYTLLGLLILFVGSISSVLGIYLCITLATVITKKHKVLTAIGIYYAYGAVSSLVMQILSFTGLYNVIDYMSRLSRPELFLCIACILFGLLGIVVAIAAGFYLVEIYLLNKRLNLE